MAKERLWIDFLNSDWHDWRGSGRSEDRLEKPEYVAEFLAARGLPALPYPDAVELASLKTLRALLREQAERLASGRQLSPSAADEVNTLLAEAPVTRRLAKAADADGGWRVELAHSNWSWPAVKADIAASFAETLASGGGSRVRICENPDCLWVFADDTRSRTKKYCDDKYCGNLMKVRRFRAKEKGGAAGG